MTKHVLKNMETYVIRTVRVDDASALIEYLDSIAADSDNLTFGPGELTITVENEAKFIQSTIDSPNQYFIVAEHKGTIIGNLNFSAGTKPRIKHQGEFGVSVRKEFWGNGVGFELINSLLNWVKETGTITKINLQVREDNESAIQLYKKLGFEFEGLIHRSFYIKGTYYNSYHMGLIIN